MAAPIISIYELTGTAGNYTEGSTTNTWAPGVVKAGEESGEKIVAVWNNHDNTPQAGTDTVHDMIECSVTALDSAGGVTDPIAAQSWINVQVNDQQNSGVDVFSPIGDGNTVNIWNNAADPAAFSGDPAKDYVLAGTDTSANPTSGFGVDTTKYAICKFKIVVPSSADPGSTGFKIRFQGYYV